ncbi:trifunctional dihydropteroate synthetase [Irineochytrium annulatum]|nr:trifunctional dihydropteroate synthetase [Irineochytrium annulatum]
MPTNPPAKRRRIATPAAPDAADGTGGDADGELEIVFTDIVAPSASSSTSVTTPTAMELHRMAREERDACLRAGGRLGCDTVHSDVDSDADDGPDGQGTSSSAAESSRRASIRLYEMAIERFSVEHVSNPSPALMLSWARCARELGAMMAVDAVLQEAETMLRDACREDGVEEGMVGPLWVEVGVIVLERLSVRQGLGGLDGAGLNEDNDLDEEEAEEAEAEQEEREEEAEGDDDEDGVDNRTASEESALFEHVRSAFRKGIALLHANKTLYVNELEIASEALMNYAIVLQKVQKKSPVPESLLIWTIAFIAQELENTDDPLSFSIESKDSLWLIKASCLYYLVRIRRRKRKGIEEPDIEGDVDDVLEAINCLEAIEGDEGKLKAQEMSGQCHVLLSSIETDEDVALEAFAVGVHYLRQALEREPENDRLRRQVESLQDAEDGENTSPKDKSAPPKAPGVWSALQKDSAHSLTCTIARSMNDRILISDLQIRNTIGVDGWERQKKQPLTLSLTVHTDVSESGGSDLLSASVNYGTVCKVVTEFSERTAYRSIEALALGIIRSCFEGCCSKGVDRITIKVEKPRALLHASSAGVEISRTRAGMEEIASFERAVRDARAAAASAPRVDAVGEDRIFIRELVVSAIIGVNAWERVEKQRVIIDVSIHLHMDSAYLVGDLVPGMHNYRTITRKVTAAVEASSFQTVEALATMIAKVLVMDCKAPKVTVKVRKPSALVFAASAGLEITRDRESFKLDGTRRGSGPARSEASGPAASEGEWHMSLIALGSNLGDRATMIDEGIARLMKEGSSRLVDTSFLYETSPMYVTDQPMFLNAACKVRTKLSPIELLKALKQIEEDMGRDFRTIRNGPRPIDMDILFYDNLEMKAEDLIIPHPRICEREFVLRPLCDIAPDFEHPSVFKTNAQLLSLLLNTATYTALPIRRVLPIRDQLWGLRERSFIMGILNVTPDSFSDGGKFIELDAAVMRVEEMVANGVDVIDIGGQSTRPKAVEVSPEDEIARVCPVIKAIRTKGIKTPISVDTFRAAVARAAVEAGADLVNDVSGGTRDPEMRSVMAELRVPVCLMHMRGDSMTMTGLTEYAGDVVGGVRDALERRVDEAVAAGVRRWRIMVDPGIGFAKTAEQSFELLRRLPELGSRSLKGLPLLVGPSRKSFLNASIRGGPKPADNRVWATAAACTASVAGGATVIRVHDVMEMRDVISVADKLYRT